MGQGDLNNKQGFYTGIGGLCPLIVNGLKYGISNTYNKTLTGAVLKGEPLPQHKKYLTQRSNSKYAALHAGADSARQDAAIQDFLQEYGNLSFHSGLSATIPS